MLASSIANSLLYLRLDFAVFYLHTSVLSVRSLATSYFRKLDYP